MESLINDERRQRIELAPATTYQRLLVHRCSAYYKLTPEVDTTTKMIYVYSTLESRIPPLRISELVPPETTAAPAFKIMRRSSTDRRGKPSHQTGSVTGDDGELSDLEPSEAGSLGGRSNTTGGSAKKHMTIEQREAAYNEARSRIFMGFEEKEKKDKDLNSSSSSLSVASGSTKNGGSSAGDADSSSSSPATESEWSGPARRGEQRQNSSASSSTRSIRSSAYISNGSGSSSRNSRAASPSSFHYPSLYEQNPPSMSVYEQTHQQQQQQHSAPAAPIYHPPYGYPYNQSQPNPPYMSYHAYYPPPYPPYSSPPHPHQPASDPTTPSNGEQYAQPPPMPYGPTYMWPHPGQPPVQSPPMQPQPIQSQQPPAQLHHAMSSPPPGQPSYQPYMHPPPHSYPYPMPGYYPNQPQPGHHMPPPPPPPPAHPPHMSGAQQLFDPKSTINGTGHNTQANGFRNSMSGNISHPPPNNNRSSQRNGYNGPMVGSGPKPRSGGNIGGGAVQPGRAPWSFGPGIGSGGIVTNPQPTNETVGPRLSNARRQSNLSSSSMNARSTSGDDVSSVASSASSSSRKAPTAVNAGSQHPLPARPDWAINLKPHNNSRSSSIMSSPISPPRSMSGGSGVQGSYPPRQHPSHSLSNPPLSLQSTDFPPLTSTSTSERRPTGAWGNPPSKPIFGQGSSVVMSPMSTMSTGLNNRLDEAGYERPPPKSVELYNPKTPKRTPLNPENAMKAQNGIDEPSLTSSTTSSPPQGGNTTGPGTIMGEATLTAKIVEQVAALSLGNGSASATGPAECSMTMATASGASPSSVSLQQ